MGREKLHIVSQTSPLSDYYRRYVCDSAYQIAASPFERVRVYATGATLALRGLNIYEILLTNLIVVQTNKIAAV